MKSKTIVLLAFAGICGLVAMLGVKKALGNKEPAVETASVLVAIADLPQASRLNETNTEFRAIPVDQVPEGAITERAQCMDRVMLIHALPGDWITESKLSDEGENGISVIIPSGMRVVTIGVNQTTSHSGMLAPGNRVDVLLTYQARTDEGSRQSTRTVLQYIEIFAVDKTIDGARANVNEANTRNVSVLVTPKQAHALLLAGKNGDIHLALRSNADTEHVDDLSIAEDDLENNGDLAGFGEKSRRDQNAERYAEGIPNEDGEVDPSPDSVDDLLQAAAGSSVASQTTVTTPPPAANVWEMTIYAGQEMKTTEVVDETDLKEPVSAAADADDTAKEKGSYWRGMLGAYFRGA